MALTRLWGLGVGMGLCISLAVACGLAQQGAVNAALWLLEGALAAGLVVVLGTWLYHRWHKMRPSSAALSKAARMGAELTPELGSALSSAIVLTPALAAALGQQPTACIAGVDYSEALAAEHLQHTAVALQAAKLPLRWQAQHSRQQRVLQGTASTVILGCLACVAFFAEGRQNLWQGLTQSQALRISDIALVADLQVHYTYPAYTHLAPRQVQGSDGRLEAVIGTEINLCAQADRRIAAAWLYVQARDGSAPTEVAGDVADARNMHFTLAVLQDVNYRFVVRLQGAAARLGDPTLHALHAVADEAPHITLDVPGADVLLRDQRNVAVHWHAEDDFGLGEIELVVEPAGAEAQHIVVWRPSNTEPASLNARATYSWAVASLGLQPGQSATFHLAAIDQDTQLGPKTGVSVTRRLTVFSARAHHEEVLETLRASLDNLVDALGFELEAPLIDAGGKRGVAVGQGARTVFDEALQRTIGTHSAVKQAVVALQGDRLAQPQVLAAFINVREHIEEILAAQRQALSQPAATMQPGSQRTQWVKLQRRYIQHLEQDIVYLDDLLAVSRIGELQMLAGDLLARQRDLKDLLSQFGDSHDPAVKAQLQQGIASLREQMRDVLSKMSQIKKLLPGEYRNIEASTMLRLDEQLQSLDRHLSQGDLRAAAQQLEQLANMVENMAQSLSETQKQYGGERYDGMRAQLKEFAQAFEAVEADQSSLSQKNAALLAQYQQQAMAHVAQNMRDFVQKARRLTHDGLAQLDQVGHNASLARQFDRELEQARQGLLDLDSLLLHEDLAEAHLLAADAHDDAELLASRILQTNDAAHSRKLSGSSAMNASRVAAQKAAALKGMLEQLFANAEQVLSPQQRQQMANLSKKQAALADKTQALSERMAQMAEQMPLFGGATKQALQQAQQQMQAAAAALQTKELGEGEGYSRQAKDKLHELRQALQHASSQEQAQGLPLPLGAPSSAGGGGAGAFETEHEEVAIPAAERGEAGPTFKKELLEAAKQRAPAYYEDAVRRYYNELIR